MCDAAQKREQLRLHEELRRANREVQALRLKYDTSLSGVDLQRTAMLAAAVPTVRVASGMFTPPLQCSCFWSSRLGHG